jgi:hypothetical protein
MKLPWKRLIRFEATDGRTLRGEPILPSEDFDLGDVTESTKLKAKVITGDDIFDTTGKTKVTDEEVTVKKLLGPLTREDVPVLRCIGLNYAKHSAFDLDPAGVLSMLTDTLHSQGSRTAATAVPFLLLQAHNVPAGS